MDWFDKKHTDFQSCGWFQACSGSGWYAHDYIPGVSKKYGVAN